MLSLKLLFCDKKKNKLYTQQTHRGANDTYIIYILVEGFFSSGEKVK